MQGIIWEIQRKFSDKIRQTNAGSKRYLDNLDGVKQLWDFQRKENRDQLQYVKIEFGKTLTRGEISIETMIQQIARDCAEFGRENTKKLLRQIILISLLCLPCLKLVRQQRGILETVSAGDFLSQVSLQVKDSLQETRGVNRQSYRLIFIFFS